METQELTLDEIKADLFIRAKAAREVLGPGWRVAARAADADLKDWQGGVALSQLAAALSRDEIQRISLGRLRKVTRALESAAGIESKTYII